MMKVPAGVKAADFSAALVEFAKIVGKDWVFTSDEDVELYRDPYSILWGDADERVASAAVAPANAEQVVDLVKIANKHRIPIYPVSTGKNLGYGGPAPALAGSVVLDLKRMNRIVEIDERNGYVVVEPGVSYFELYNAIQERGLKLWIDCAGPGWGSLIGNALDGGVGYTLAPYRCHFDAQCGIEVVLPTGKLLRTGMGALPGSKTWQQFRPGFGPRIDGLFKQSNFGVITKMGFWLMPPPENHATGVVTVPRFRDMTPLIDAISRLEQAKIFQGYWLISSPTTAQKDPEFVSIFNSPAGIDRGKLEAKAISAGVPYWSCEMQFYGPQNFIKAQWDCVRDALAGIEGAAFNLKDIHALPYSRDELAVMRDTVQLGIPTLRTFGLGPLVSYEGETVVGQLFFSPVIPRTGEAVMEAMDVVGAIYHKHKIPSPLIQFPTGQVERAFLFVVALPVTRSSTVNAKVREIFAELVAAAAAHGWGEYRTAPAFYDHIMETYSFNDHALREFLERIKDAVDPNGIISAGRYGIWPAHLRKGKGRPS
jgi:4-cresol dehydrogenase (hydroxylating)